MVVLILAAQFVEAALALGGYAVDVGTELLAIELGKSEEHLACVRGVVLLVLL
jgi:hypothetical protein